MSRKDAKGVFHMQHVVLRLTVAALTFVIGVSCTISYRASTFHRVNVLLAREAAFRDDLFVMRKMIDQYAVDRGSLPRSLDDLVKAGYLCELPEDTFTGQRDWVVVVGDDPNLSGDLGGDLGGIINVHSASLAKSPQGTAYNQW
jgi:hypothetical protein